MEKNQNHLAHTMSAEVESDFKQQLINQKPKTMINLDFELNDQANQYQFHKLDQNLVLVVWNGYSYTRVIWPMTEASELINKIQNKQNEQIELI